MSGLVLTGSVSAHVPVLVNQAGERGNALSGILHRQYPQPEYPPGLLQSH